MGEEAVKLILGEEEYEIDAETAQKVGELLSAGGFDEPKMINGVDVEVINLLEEVATADWGKLVPDDHTAALIAMGLFVDYYDYHEGARELTNYHVGYFLDREWTVGEHAERVLEIIKSGKF